MATPMEFPEEPWEITLQGKKYYAATGTRDVLILVSSESGSEDIVARKIGELTLQDKDRLDSEGIRQNCREDDAEMAKEKYMKIHEGENSHIKTVKIVEEAGMTKEYVMNEIKDMFSKSKEDGVVLHYIGPGHKDTGDWCFNDGFISFTDIAELYMQHFTGKSLHVISDCSYSGQWVESCMDFLDSKGVQPCGHSAKEKGIKIKVFCSCQPDQIGYSLLCTARRLCNDKNTGLPYLKETEDDEEAIEPDQTACNEDFTVITCSKLPAEECVLLPNFTFKEKIKKMKRNRIKLIKGHYGQYPVWWYEIPPANLLATATFQDIPPRLQGTPNNSVSDHNVTLISGLGKEPPQDIKDWARRLKNGLEDLPSLD